MAEGNDILLWNVNSVYGMVHINDRLFLCMRKSRP